MKTSAITQFLLLEKNSKGSSTGNFEKFIENNSYYQHRKNHWEKSYLSFKPLKLSYQPHPLVKTCDGQKVKDSKQINSLSLKTVNHEYEQEIASAFNRESLNLSKDQPPPIKTSSSLNVCINETKNPFSQTQSKHALHKSSLIFKQFLKLNNHHLYLSENINELSIALKEMDDKQLAVTIKAIRQLLKQKSIHLTTLLINGVRHP